MSNREIFQQYSDSVKQLRKQCLDQGMSEEEFKKMYFENLKDLNINPVIYEQKSFLKRYKLLIVLFLISLTIYYYKPIYSCLVCTIQEYIYPGLSLLRKISIPLISLFPALTDLYQETCLVQNPFFTVVDMDCWPCSSVSNIGEIFNPQKVQKEQNAPFIYKTEQPSVDFKILKDFYDKNKNKFDKDGSQVFKNNKYYISSEDVFSALTTMENLYIWKLNNFNTARMLRQLIPRPRIVPKFGQSVERFIIIDSKHDTFRIPDTECNYAFLLVLSGSRVINLHPAEECIHQCKSLKVELKEPYLLWYNWWYWRPSVQQSWGNETFIAHVGSYC